MENQELIKQVTEKAEKWLTPAYDAETQAEVKRMLENDDKTELIEAFYKDLEFGTGGLRGIMGVGSNRMNIYTVGAATQGLSNYLKKNFKDLPQISVVVGHDCRNNSRLFAETSANIFSANGIKVYLFDDMRPTPEMSFAIRHLGCQSGIILTASHNPKEYNGYKAYWDDGAQVLAPHDKGIIDEVNAIASAADIKFQGNPDLIQIIGEDIDKIYLDMVKTVSIDPAAIARHKDMKIVYTPIHGTGMMLIPRALKMWGFENVFTVPEQMIKDGNFPTVVSPNPENAEALTMALNLAKEIDADLVMASDPDADRVGIACKNDKGEWGWQRPRLFCTTEDLFTQSFILPYVIPMLENAGANVYTPRERDTQKNEVIVDNDTRNGSIYLEMKSRKARWEKTDGYGFAQRKPVYEDGENPFLTGSARFTRTEKKKNKAFAEWIPTIPETGSYAVYVSYQTLPNSVSDAKYLVFHKGGVTEFKVNQRIGGGTWVYLGTFEFDKGSNDYGMVVLSNESKELSLIHI